jgi:hypothetical protein
MKEEEITLQQEDNSTDGTSQERYADELVGPDDYWLTITDAARATRRQDVSIRRWISKGLLPVRRQHVGLNQRTRLVRASDLAKLTPIIDPAGAISTERSKLDLTSIPVQQAQLKASQQELLVQLKDVQEFARQEGETLRRMIDEQEQQQRTALEALRTETTTRLRQQYEKSEQQTHKLGTALAQQQANTTTALEELAGKINLVMSSLTQRIDVLHEQEQALTEAWQQTTQRQQEQIETLTAHLQEEKQVREHLTVQVNQLTEQQAQQLVKYEQEVHLREQLADKVQQLTNQLAEQQVAHVHEVQARERLQQQLAAQQSMHDQTLQQIQTSIQEQQQHYLTSLSQQLQQFDRLSHSYVNLLKKNEEFEKRLAEMTETVEQQRHEMTTLALAQAKEKNESEGI